MDAPWAAVPLARSRHVLLSHRTFPMSNGQSTRRLDRTVAGRHDPAHARDGCRRHRCRSGHGTAHDRVATARVRRRRSLAGGVAGRSAAARRGAQAGLGPRCSLRGRARRGAGCRYPSCARADSHPGLRWLPPILLGLRCERAASRPPLGVRGCRFPRPSGPRGGRGRWWRGRAGAHGRVAARRLDRRHRNTARGLRVLVLPRARRRHFTHFQAAPGLAQPCRLQRPPSVARRRLRRTPSSSRRPQGNAGARFRQ